jgi:MFS superfamily sulfate permease-like transporter
MEVHTASKHTSLSGDLNMSLNNALFAGVILAVVGSVESLATASRLAIYAEKSRGVALKIQLNKELIAQGVGNLTAGFFGGIPVTAVIVRSAANVQFGASSRVSTMLHGLWILLSVIVFGSVLRYIPLSALAAILVVTGVRLVNIRVFLSHARHGTSHAMAYMVTFSAILPTNLLRGLICGMVFAGGSWILQRYQVRAAS